MKRLFSNRPGNDKDSDSDSDTDTDTDSEIKGEPTGEPWSHKNEINVALCSSGNQKFGRDLGTYYTSENVSILLRCFKGKENQHDRLINR